MWKIISAYIEFFILMISVTIFGKIVIKEQSDTSRIRRIIIFIIISILQTIVFLRFDGPIKTIIMLFNNMLFFKYEFSLSFSKAILIACLYMILLIIPEIIEIVFMTKVLKINQDFFYNTYSGTAISSLTICILLSIITYMMREILRKIINIKIKDNLKIVIYYILTF